jgi:hypothetical protein
MWRCAQFIRTQSYTVLVYERNVEKTRRNKVKVGDRVGCFLSVVRPKALLLGYGTYVGEEVPPNEGLGSLTGYLSGQRLANPKIVLDSGDVVWGCECWWGPEEEIMAECATLDQVVEISVEDARHGKIPAGFEEQKGEGPPMGDFFGSGSSDKKDFWS